MVVTLHDVDPTAATSSAGMGSLLRVRFAVLWLIIGCATAGSYAVFFAEPGRLEEGVAGVMEGEPVTTGWAYVFAAMVGVPLALAAAALFLPARAGAVVHLVAGLLVGALGVYAIAAEVSEGALHPHAALAAFGSGVAWLIVGLSIADLRDHPREAAPVAAVGRAAA
jgi:hypothetical protein